MFPLIQKDNLQTRPGEDSSFDVRVGWSTDIHTVMFQILPRSAANGGLAVQLALLRCCSGK